MESRTYRQTDRQILTQQSSKEHTPVCIATVPVRYVEVLPLTFLLHYLYLC